MVYIEKIELYIWNWVHSINYVICEEYIMVYPSYNSYMNHIVRMRWEDAEEIIHPQTGLGYGGG